MNGARRLSEWRRRKGLSQWDLADLIGVGQGTVSRWEADEAAPLLKFAIKLAKVTKGAVPVECWDAAVSRGAA